MDREGGIAGIGGASVLWAAERATEAEQFDEFVENEYRRFYAEKMGRPGLTPGTYFRCLLVGYSEGIDSERGIAWRAADSLGIRQFLGIGLDEQSPDHSTISRTRRLIALETHEQVFGFVLRVIAARGLMRARRWEWMRRHWKPTRRYGVF